MFRIKMAPPIADRHTRLGYSKKVNYTFTLLWHNSHFNKLDKKIYLTISGNKNILYKALK